LGDDLKSFLTAVLAGIVAAVVLGIPAWLYPRLTGRNPRYDKYRLAVSTVLFVILSSLCRIYLPQGWVVFSIIILIVLSCIIFFLFDEFWSLGVVGADRHTKSGVDYRVALSICTSSLDFLGIGAGKLRSVQDEFEKAIDRCSRPDRPIRFLLCRPDSEELRRIAQSARKPEDEFKKGVLESLRVLAKLRNERAKNIEVRLYREFPVFRLMFINDEICLASHYILGKGGDGSEAPQLHLVKTSEARDVESLYYGFHLYFDSIWDSSEEWDFSSFT
jgi:hypothetical protein